jgi:hypothetical protein
MMGRVFDEMKAFFDGDEWNTTPLPDAPHWLRMGFRGDDGEWRCYAQADEDREIFAFYSVASVSVPEARRHAVMEFLTRANYGMTIGNFEIDLNDGEVRYKTSVDVEGTPLSFMLAKRMVYANVTTMDRYLRGILAVAFGGVEPTAAIAEIETH